MAFYYGEATANTPTGDGTVTVTLALIGSGPMATGRISGRYLTGTDSGPTANVAIKYYPPNRAEGLLIENSVITNGWFSFLVLDGNASTKLGYEMPGGQKLWGRPVNLSDVEFDPGTRVVRASVPIHIRQESGGGGQTTWVYEDPTVNAYGFFAPSDASLISSKYVCYPGSTPSLGRLSVWVGSIGVSPPAMPGMMITSGSIALPTVAELTATPNSVGGYRIKGGQPSGCSNPLDHIDLNSMPSWMDGNGGDAMSYVYPPLMPQSSGGTASTSRGPFIVSGGSGTVNIAGAMLPGVTTSLFDTVKVYKRVKGDSWQWQNGGAPCVGMSNGAYEFQPATTSAILGNGSFNFSLPISLSDGSIGTSVGICFEGPANVPNVGFVMNYYHFQNQGGGGGGGGGPYLRLEISDTNMGGGNVNAKLTKDYCHLANMSSYIGMGSTNVAVGTVSVSGLPNTGVLKFYSDSGCTNGNEITSTTIPNGNYQSGNFYAKATAATTNISLTGITASNTATFDSMQYFDVGDPYYLMIGPTRVKTNLCYQYNAAALLANGSSYPLSPTNLSFNFQGDTTVYSGMAACTASSPSLTVTLTGGTSAATFYAKTTAGPTASGTFGVSGGTLGILPHSFAVLINGTTGTNQGRYMRFSPVNPPLLVSRCNAIRVSVVNEAEIEIPVDSPVPLKLSDNSTAGSFYSEPGCNMYDPFLSIMPGESGKIIYYMPYQTGAVSVQGLPNTLSMSPGSSMTVSLPGSGPYLTFYPPGIGSSSKVLSSLQFGSIAVSTPTSLQSSIGTPAGATLECFYYAGMWTPCSGAEFSGSTFTWTTAAAVAGTTYRFRSSMNGFPSVEAEFDPKKIWGEAFEVVNCATPVTSGTIAVDTLVGNPSPICLGQSVALDCGSTTGTLGVGMKIIGWSTKNNVTSSVGNSTCFTMNGLNISGTKTHIANLNFNMIGNATGTQVGLNFNGLTAAGSGAVVISSSSFTTDASGSGASHAIAVSNNVPNAFVFINDSNFTVTTTNAQINTGLYLANNNMGPVFVANSNFNSTGSATSAKAGITAYLTGGTLAGPLNITKTSMIGTGLSAIGIAGSTGRMPPILMANSQVNLSLASPVAHGIILWATPPGSDHKFMNNLITYDGNASYSMFSLDGRGVLFNPSFVNNKFVHTSQGQLMSMTTANGGPNANIEFTGNSFLSTSTTSSGNSRVFYQGSTDTYNLTSPSPSNTGGNLVCETDAGTHGWSGSPITAPAGGSVSAFPSGFSSVTPVANGCP